MIESNIYSETELRHVLVQKGIFSVLEYEKDMSVSPGRAETAYYAALMDVRKRQLIANINKDVGVVSQKGMLQLILGDVMAETGIENPSDLMKKIVGSKVTKETAIKPRYRGNGNLILEPTYRYIILEDLKDWNGNMVIEDGMFLACEDTVKLKVSPRTTISSAALGGEGFFNLSFRGEGVVALESSVPRQELFEINVKDDVVKVDGNMAIAWSGELDFTVERTTKTLIGSLAAGEGLVNVYKGTGKILVAPVAMNNGITVPETNKK